MLRQDLLAAIGWEGEPKYEIPYVAWSFVETPVKRGGRESAAACWDALLAEIADGPQGPDANQQLSAGGGHWSHSRLASPLWSRTSCPETHAKPSSAASAAALSGLHMILMVCDDRMTCWSLMCNLYDRIDREAGSA